MENSEIFRWVILPLLIFIARVFDVTLGTIKIIYISKGHKYIAPVLAFFEIMVWITAMGQIMKNLDNVLYYFAYGGGFAMGNFIGILIENKLALGTLAIRIITMKDASELIIYLRNTGYGVTTVEGNGVSGKVNIIYMVVKRKDQKKILKIINRFNPKAFISVEEVRQANEGVFPVKRNHYKPYYFKIFRKFKKGK